MIELFGLFVNSQIINLFFTTRAISESNKVVEAFVKKSSKILYYCNRLQLVRMMKWIKKYLIREEMIL